MYHAIHIPSFCRAYQDLWSTKVANVDLIWLGLLFIMISTTALLVPHSHVGELGLDIPRARDLANFWYEACRQAQFVGDYEAKPTLTQIQIFLCSQTYWLETKNYEVLNSQLGQMVRNAQALGLDKDKPGASIVETELRRRAFWELFVCDAYQALCLDRAPLLDSAPKIPKPIHCNDVDITENGIQERPSSEVTDMSANLAHYNVYVVLRKGFHDMSSYEKVQQIDEEIKAAVARFPWYFQLHDARNKSLFLDTVAWQYNILHMGICLLRIRISRPFMHAKIGEAWYVCANAAQDMLLPYRRMRQADPQGFLQSPKFVIQAYQAYTAAVAVAAFLLVDRALPNLPSESMFHDVEMVINDLDQSDLGPMLAGGVKVLRRMLHLFINNQSRDPQAREGIVTEIASVFGGEQHTRSYLKPRSPDSVPDSNAQAVTTAVGPQPLITNTLPTPVTATTFAPQAWPISSLINMPEQAPEPAAFAPDIMNYPVALDFQTALDMLNCDQWFDFTMPTTLTEHATF
ncbi:ATP-dependent DNA helicase sgs1 [Ascosphaera pollenicola]|nr:ATP-dependent DNA helicase sgs1 [Ascosphaera pollenicola]